MRRNRPYAEYIEDSDILFVGLFDAPIARTREGGNVWINVDYTADERVVAVEIVSASADHDLGAVPHCEEIGRLIEVAGLPFTVEGGRLRRLAPTGQSTT